MLPLRIDIMCILFIIYIFFLNEKAGVSLNMLIKDYFFSL